MYHSPCWLYLYVIYLSPSLVKYMLYEISNRAHVAWMTYAYIYITSQACNILHCCHTDLSELAGNKTLPYITAFNITDIAVPVNWYTVEAGRNDTI